MESNYNTIKKDIEEYSFKYLKNTKEIQILLDKLYEESQMIQNSQKTQLISAALIYSYLRANKLNGRGGITIKALSNYFNISTQSVNQKVFDVDCIVNREAIFQDKPFEYIDEERFEISELFYNFLDSDESNNFIKSEKILKSLIKKDPYYFDTYSSLHEYYLENNQIEKAFNLMATGCNKALYLIEKKSRFPDTLLWGFTQNRHIIRVIFNFALLLWLANNKNDALDLLKKLLKSNPDDNIGARYCIAGILDGFKSYEQMEEKFLQKDGYLDWEKQDKWFNKISKKYKI